MEREDDILQRAIEQVRNEEIPSHPPQEAIDATLAKLAEAADRTSTSPGQRNTHVIRLTTKLAAAAAVLILAGYAVGRLSAPRPPDINQLQHALAASIEPAIRQKVIEDLNRQWQSALEASHVALREDLTQQYRNDLIHSAAQTLAVSNATTHRLLEDLIESINVAEVQKRQWVATALAEIDATRRQDSTQFANALVSLAAATGGEIERTKNDMVSLLYTTRDGLPGPDQHDSITD